MTVLINTVDATDGRRRFVVKSPYGMREKLKAIPGREWCKELKAWVFPATGAAAVEITRACKAALLPDGGFLALRDRYTNTGLERDEYDNDRYDDPPFDWETKPFNHQIDGYEFAHYRDAALLYWEMGTGKSMIVVDLVINSPTWKRVLIVCPKSVMNTWVDQFEEHSRHREYVPRLFINTLNQRTTKLKSEWLAGTTPNCERGVFIVNYDSVWRGEFGEAVLDFEWDLVVADEAHKLKSAKGKASKFFERLHWRARKRIALTGTPMPHSPLDVFGLMRFLDPGVFGTSHGLFMQRYAVQVAVPGAGRGKIDPRAKQTVGFKNLDDLRRRMEPLTDRVLKKDVLDLPDVQHVRVSIELEPKTRRAYDEFDLILRAKFSDGEVTANNALVHLLRLQQITSGHVKTDEGDVVETGTEKAEALADLIDGLGRKEPLVVFCRFRHDLQQIEKVTKDAGRIYRELSGERKENREWAQYARDFAGPVIGVQIQAGGVGINEFVAARHCVFFSLGFSLGDYEQALARLHRKGQEQKVTYYHLVGSRTVDEKVYDAMSKKKAVIDVVLEGFGRG